MKALFLLLFSALSLWAESSRPSQPNIILLLVDDLGWQDVGVYDIEEPGLMQTPHIDALAKSGVQFWQGYSPAPTCSPSRAAIMSGLHPARSHNTHINGGVPPKVDPQNGGVLITPWYSGRVSTKQPTIAGALKEAGYATGHTGKWHMSADLFSYPTPTDVGFDFTTHDEEFMLTKYNCKVKGIQNAITSTEESKRPLEYSTKDSPYALDESGFPIDPNQVETIKYMEENKDRPFFLFNATWLVHAPIQSRSEQLVNKYYKLYTDELAEMNKTRLAAEKEALPIEPLDAIRWKTRGRNPYYLAMIETLDHHIGQTINYLKETEDPRWKGHKLIENTYIAFTSDNGGVISARAEQITTNTPLTKGKKYTNEGGTRVPFIFSGPGIKANQQSNVLINGLDLYPTILEWAGIEPEKNTTLDGLGLANLLAQNPAEASLVKHPNGAVRTEMFWHFPHTTQCSATMRDEHYKAIYNFGSDYIPGLPEIELYKLYTEEGKRGDLEEAIPLTDASLQARYKSKILDYLSSYDANLPHYNPKSASIEASAKNECPVIIEQSTTGNTVTVNYKTRGSKLKDAYILYKIKTLVSKNGRTGNEWLKQPASIDHDQLTISATLPPNHGAIVCLVDENNFLVTDPHTKNK